jgi:hypothetical protein
MPKRVLPLSEEKVNAAKVKEKAYKLFDGGGLSLLVTPSGGKLWRFKYRFNRTEKNLSLGSYPETSLEDARSNRDAARSLLEQGIDPSAIRKEDKVREKAARLESKRTPSMRITLDGKIEIWKGANTMRLTLDEARFVGELLSNVTR